MVDFTKLNADFRRAQKAAAAKDRGVNDRLNGRSFMSTTYPRLSARPRLSDIERDQAAPEFWDGLLTYVDQHA